MGGNGNGGARCQRMCYALAGTLAYLDWAFSHGEEPNLVEDCFLRNAARLVRDYFWPHSRAALRQIGLTERHADERRLLRWLAANKRTEISLTEARRDALAQRLDAEQTQHLLAGLVRARWLRQVTIETGGRPRQRWKVNPRLFSISDTETAASAGSL